MNTLFNSLKGKVRLLLEAELKPVQGDRFQPTGFADLGAAVYQVPSGMRKLLVESAQSVANRLEQTIIGSDNQLIEEVEGLSYIKVKLTGAADTYTSSLIEAHRINSPFIISNEGFRKAFVQAAQYQKGKPINWKTVAGALFKYDINSLLHGTFMANLEDGRIKIARSISGFIEADNIREAVSGGVKLNTIDPTGTLRAEDYDKDVYGNVPYQRVEYTAERLVAYFNIDLGLLRSYELGGEAFELLTALALYKVRIFLENGLRLRTACDLTLHGNLKCTSPDEFAIPSAEELLTMIQQGIITCEKLGLFADPAVTELETKVKIKVKAGKGTEEDKPLENQESKE